MIMDVYQPVYFGEIWLPVTQKSAYDVVEGYYIVSNYGRVYSFKRQQYLNLVKTDNGYYRVNLRKTNKTSRYYLIHRIVMIEFNPVPNYESLQVNHFDGNKANNAIWNLEWVTGSENLLHAFKFGLKTQYKGEECSFATISNAQAEQIAQMILSDKYTYQQIADIIGCTKSVVSDIATGSTWKDTYKKYKLEDHKKQFKIRLSDNDLHRLCKYWEDNKGIYTIRTDLFRKSLHDVLGVEFDQGMSATLTRLFNRQTRTDITSQYNF